MKTKNMIDDTIESIKSGIESIGNSYESFVREKAIEEVNQRIEERGIEIEDITKEDYEAMVSDLSKDIKENYAKKTSQGLLLLMGLDFFLG